MSSGIWTRFPIRVRSSTLLLLRYRNCHIEDYHGFVTRIALMRSCSSFNTSGLV